MTIGAGVVRLRSIVGAARGAALGTAIAILVALTAAGAGAAPFEDPATALRDYVAAEDPAYGYRLVDSSSGDGYTTHLLRMTSQRWRAPGEAMPTLWRHWLVVVVPDRVSEDVAGLVIAGGSGRARPALDDDEIKFGAQLAVLSKTVVAILMQAPYQPIAFPDAATPLNEDALVAYSWDKAIKTGDYSWAAYLPMTKAAVRAMDTVQDFVPAVAPAAVERFVVIGASKRGAATWLAAAVDPRVKAIAPMVIDILSFSEQMAHHLAVYGGYAPALRDYVEYGLVQRVDTPEGVALRQVIDPISYLDALDLPKYIIGSTGDQFFPPDAAQFYFPQLPGESLLRYVPDSDHSLSNTEASLIDTVSGLFGWYLAIVEDQPRPTISWQRAGDEVVVRTSPRALAARLWKARNPEARDFRLSTIGEAWHVTELRAVRRGEYAVRVVEPPTGWKAYFVELVYPSPLPGLCQVYGTPVFVTPEIRPFEGMQPPVADAVSLAADGSLEGAGAPQALVELRPAGLLDDIFDDVAEDVHGDVLDEAVDEGDLGERALRHCFAHDLDELRESVEVYVRLGFGQSVEGFLEGRLEDLWRDLRERGEELIDDAKDKVDDAIDDLF
jgi:PhoPQ-activated pathogenicity-related protein